MNSQDIDEGEKMKQEEVIVNGDCNHSYSNNSSSSSNNNITGGDDDDDNDTTTATTTQYCERTSMIIIAEMAPLVRE